jgi:hypothetical protein
LKTTELDYVSLQRIGLCVVLSPFFHGSNVTRPSVRDLDMLRKWHRWAGGIWVPCEDGVGTQAGISVAHFDVFDIVA